MHLKISYLCKAEDALNGVRHCALSKHLQFCLFFFEHSAKMEVLLLGIKPESLQ